MTQTDKKAIIMELGQEIINRLHAVNGITTANALEIICETFEALIGSTLRDVPLNEKLPLFKRTAELLYDNWVNISKSYEGRRN